jgi:hypothetical protein
MTCYHPVECWYSTEGEALRFRRPGPGDGSWCHGTKDCMKCRGCLRKYAGEWAIRCVHESKCHSRSCFVTLTYDWDHLPVGGSLRKRDFISFIKRLRNAYRDLRIRFFGCGEYGGRTGRAHYHICLFGVDFDDSVLAARSSSGQDMMTSKTLDSIWGKGLATVQPLTEATAGYTAGYVMKKLDKASFRPGQDRAWWMTKAPVREKEFIHMSRNPGIGQLWFERYHGDVFKRDAASKELRDQVVMLNEKGSSRETCAPGYYMRLLRKWCEDDYQEIKDRRMDESLKTMADRTRKRLGVREVVDQANGARQKRDAF